MASNLNIYIVDDDIAVLTAMSKALRKRDYQVQTFASAVEFLKAYNPDFRGCLVLDLSMPDMDGLTLQTKLNEIDCNLPIIFITGHGGVTESVNALKSGAVDFLQKPFKQEKLLAAIESAFSLFSAAQNISEEDQTFLVNYEKLSTRERQLVSSILEDHSDVSSKTLARKLGISHRTIDQHRARIFIKMDVNSMTELVAILTRFKTRNGNLPTSTQFR
jgi:FixJ family two-component response regulator